MSTTIVCGVNCACAPTPSAPAQQASNCNARESCVYAREGKCTCGGQCAASQAKAACGKAAASQCSCAPGTCAAAEDARASCTTKQGGGCSCAPGQCKVAGFTA